MKKLLKSIIESNKKKVVVENAILTISTVGDIDGPCNYCIFRDKACPGVFHMSSDDCEKSIGMEYFIIGYEETAEKYYRKQ